MAKKTKTKSLAIKNANQFIADPRQAIFLAYYLDPDSNTFANALQSALRAGYAQEYAENIMSKMPKWLSEKVGDSKANTLLEKAERNLAELLELPSKTQAVGAFGLLFDKEKQPIMVHNVGLLKVKGEITKFVAEKIGRGRYAKDPEEAPKVSTHYTQIIINPPSNEKQPREATADKSNGKTVFSVASPSKPKNS